MTQNLPKKMTKPKATMSMRSPLHPTIADEQVRRMKEFIELLAGPKWKTFIRRRGRKRRAGEERTQWDFGLF